MSVEKWFGSYGTIPIDKYADKLKEAVELLCEHTSVTIDSTITNTSSEYTVILNCGEGVYVKLSVDESNTQLTFSAGYKTGGEYTSTYSQTWTITAVTIERSCEIYNINGSNVWELRFPSGYSSNNVQCSVLRGTKLVSSVAEYSTWAIGIYRGYESNLLENGRFCVIDKILVNDAWYMIHAYEPNSFAPAVNNVPAEKMMLFPLLIAGEAYTELGVPTIGNKQTYLMSSWRQFGIQLYDEFYVGQSLFVSLGHIAIRSS